MKDEYISELVKVHDIEAGCIRGFSLSRQMPIMAHPLFFDDDVQVGDEVLLTEKEDGLHVHVLTRWYGEGSETPTP